MNKGDGGEVSVPSPEEYMPLVQQMADINRLDQITPFGGVRYTNQNVPLSQADWLTSNAGASAAGGPSIDMSSAYWQLDPEARGVSAPRPSDTPWDIAKTGDYEDYLTGFDRGETTAEAYLSPELQSLFTKQFQPGAYSQYGEDYMANARRYLDPVYEQQQQRFEQTMANRGQPAGGELYGDLYSDLMGAQEKGWQEAAFGATQAGERARLQDYNRLMTAMGMGTVQTPQVDVMGPASMAMNADIANIQAQNQGAGNIFNTAAGLGGAYMMGAPDDSWLWS